ncbi:MAG: hypothetical protein NC177_12980 [Ruminococcus flavefaciens]|nr:hypothetical protein [Ruminococcus flavefaciens]
MKKKSLLAKIVSLAMIFQSISTTSLVAFAEENVNINVEETISTTDNDDEYTSYFDAVIDVSVWPTGEKLEGVDVKFVEYSEDTSLNPDAEVLAVLDSWNTSDSNPHTIENIKFVKGHFYCAEVEQFPDGYSVGGRSSDYSGYHGNGVLSGTMPYHINPEHKDPFVELDFPVESSLNATFSVRDIVDKEYFSGLDIELVSMDSDYNVQSVLAEWNTSEDIVYSIELPYYFENDNSSSCYGVKIKNLPEGYVYNNTGSTEASCNGYSVFFYSTLDLQLEIRDPELFGGVHNYVVDLREENAVVENTTRPHTTTTTTAVAGDNATTTTTISEDDTTTTTTVSEDDTTTTTTVSEDDTTTTTAVSEDDTTTTTAVSEDDTTTTTAVSEDDTTTTTTVSEYDTTTTTTVSDNDTTTTTTANNTEDLPQAGMPFARLIETMSLMLVIGGTMLVVKSKRNEK